MCVGESGWSCCPKTTRLPRMTWSQFIVPTSIHHYHFYTILHHWLYQEYITITLIHEYITITFYTKYTSLSLFIPSIHDYHYLYYRLHHFHYLYKPSSLSLFIQAFSTIDIYKSLHHYTSLHHYHYLYKSTSLSIQVHITITLVPNHIIIAIYKSKPIIQTSFLISNASAWSSVALLSVHTRSELSDQIAGSHSLSMGKSDRSDQSDQRYQRPKLSDQSVKKKLKTF
jgi:hypothetical protein